MMNVLALIFGLSGLMVVCFLIWRAHYRKSELAVVPRMTTLGAFNKPDLRKAICTNIRANLSLHGDGVAVVGNKKDALLVKWAIDNDYIDKSDFEQAVHEAICQVGRRMFDWHRTNPHRNYPDHALSTEALGYAILHGELSTEEVVSIRFDHGETADKYIQSASGLFEKVMAQLRNGTAFFDLSALGKVGECDELCDDCH